MKNNKVIAAAATALVLAACGGAEKSANMPATDHVQPTEPKFERINGLLVPPAPPIAENNKTIEGIDIDKNGVRDDMDRWAAQKFGHIPAIVHPVYMTMRANQMRLTSSPSTQAEAVAILKESIQYGTCGWKVIDDSGVDFGEVADEVALRTVNTRMRIDKLNSIKKLAGSFTSSANSIHKDCTHPQ